jgi:hypothetical protein
MKDPYYYVLISALTSALVALGIELVAKPRMEARKERILGDHRSRLRFDQRLTQIIVMSATWEQFVIPPGTREDFRDRLESEQARALRELDEITQVLIDELGSYAGTYVSWNLPVLGTTGQAPIARYAFIARGISLSDRPAIEKLRSLKEISLVMQEALFSRWHAVRRARALQKLPGLLDQYAPSESVQPPESSAVPVD